MHACVANICGQIIESNEGLPVHPLADGNVILYCSKRQVSTTCQGFDIVLELQHEGLHAFSTVSSVLRYFCCHHPPEARLV